MTDEGAHGDEEFLAAKGTRRFFIGHWGGEGVIGFGLIFIIF